MLSTRPLRPSLCGAVLLPGGPTWGELFPPLSGALLSRTTSPLNFCLASRLPRQPTRAGLRLFSCVSYRTRYFSRQHCWEYIFSSAPDPVCSRAASEAAAFQSGSHSCLLRGGRPQASRPQTPQFAPEVLGAFQEPVLLIIRLRSLVAAPKWSFVTILYCSECVCGGEGLPKSPLCQRWKFCQLFGF